MILVSDLNSSLVTRAHLIKLLLAVYIQVDDGVVDTFHVPRTGYEGGAIGIGSADDTGRECHL